MEQEEELTDDEREKAEQNEREALRRAAELSLLLLTLLAAKNRPALDAQVRFDAEKGRFYYKGKSVSVRQIRNYLIRIEGRQAQHLADITGQLAEGTLTINEWKREFDRTITTTHILAGAFAVGSIAAAAANDRIAASISSELQYADAFAKEVRADIANISKAKLIARAKSYARAAHLTFANAELAVRRSAGLQTEARRVRRAAESCGDCIIWARRGWMPIEIMRPIGTLKCGHFCRCYIEYR